MNEPGYPSNTRVQKPASSHQSEADAARRRLRAGLPEKARDIMKVGVKTVDRTATVYEAVRILVERHITGLPVVDDTKLIGVITERDVLNLISRTGCQLGCVGDHMTAPVVTFDETASVAEVWHCLLNHHFRRVPILRDGTLAGIISRADLLCAYRETFGPTPLGRPSHGGADGPRVREVMTAGLLTTRPEAPIFEAMSILVAHGITGLPVVDGQMNLVGLVSEKDLLALVPDPGARSCRVGDLMSRDLTTFEVDAPVFDVCACLANSNFRRVPIVEGGKLVGLVSRSDLIVFLLKHPSVLAPCPIAPAGGTLG